MEKVSSGEALPTVALLLSKHLQRRLFTDEALQQLATLATVVQFPEGCPDANAFSTLLVDASICITGWDTPSLPLAVLQDCSHLRLIAHTAGTVHTLFHPSIFSLGIRVTHSAAALAEGVAEFTVAQALMSLTQLHTFDQLLRRRASWEEMRDRPVGHLLSAQVVGIVGAGRIGRDVIKRLRPFGCRIIVYDPSLSLADARDLGVELYDLDALFALADIVSLHAPLLATTRGMIGAPQLALMRDGAILLNTARAHLIDEDALLYELQSGRILAALDVFHEEPLPPESPLLALPNVILSPHAGALTKETLFKQGQMMLDEVQRFLRGEPLAYEIFPDQLPNMA